MASVFVDFGNSTTTFSFASSDKINFNVGYETLSNIHFKHNLPTPYQTELAIITIENAIESIYAKWQQVDKIFTNNEYVHFIVSHFGKNNQISTIEIEQLFNQVADVISGLPRQEVASLLLPDIIAILLILREIIHHLGIETIEVI
ncbi:hypothetical protein RHO12_12435 [Orbus sturtevantii]|uniref:hypothetical protein n=1 Tax=Orbus sturtevantii TaxID=3074109 RepID=UPI00370DBBF2